MEPGDRIAMQERGLDILARSKDGFKFTSTFFPYTSGEIGPYYVQSGGVQCTGRDYITAINDMASLVSDAIGAERVSKAVVSGGETRDWIFSNPVAFKLGMPHVMLYKDGKTVGADMNGMEDIHVADLNNEGSSLRDYWVPIIKKAGGTIQDVFFYVDRMEDGVQVVRDLGLRSHAGVPLDAHAWDYSQKIEIVNPEVYKSLMERAENKDDWARAMLRSLDGIDTLAALIASAKTLDKAKRILDVGYPDMKAELIDRLKSRVGRGIVSRL